jgi:hypothetical protein
MQLTESPPRIAQAVLNQTDVHEQRIWRTFYRRIRNPDLASEVLQILESNLDLKRRSPGLYLRARETMARDARRRALRSKLSHVIGHLLGQHRGLDQALAAADARLWRRFYRQIADPVIAREVIAFLEQHPERQASVSGLYLAARQTLHREQRRQARWQGIVVLWRSWLGWTAPEIPSSTQADAVTERVQALSGSPEYANAKAVFDRSEAMTEDIGVLVRDREAESGERAKTA